MKAKEIINRLKTAVSGRLHRFVMPYQCYHCGEVFWKDESARKHFGRTSAAMPRCVLQKCQCFDCPATSEECDRFKA